MAFLSMMLDDSILQVWGNDYARHFWVWDSNGRWPGGYPQSVVESESQVEVFKPIFHR
jgi:hypothetical protein